MTVGALTRLLTLQEPLRTPDGGGGFATAWQDIAQDPAVFASVAEIGGGEELRQMQLAGVQKYRILIRHRADITADMRLTEGVGIYAITGIRDPDGKRMFLEIMAEGA